MLIDCDRCVAGPAACGDCVVSVLLGPTRFLDDDAQAAIGVLAGSGLVPPLRLLPDEPESRRAG